MTKLSDTQLVILSAATQREDRNVLPLPGSLRGGAAAKERRVRLREALLRFHPDKFEGRCLRYVREADQERVREGVAEVTRGINALLLQCDELLPLPMGQLFLDILGQKGMLALWSFIIITQVNII